MTCRAFRRVAGVVAAVAWLAAVVVTLRSPQDEHTNVVLLLVCVACAGGICSAISYLLAKGSAEKVWDLGYQAGYAEARKELYDWPPREGGKVHRLSAYR